MPMPEIAGLNVDPDARLCGNCEFWAHDPSLASNGAFGQARCRRNPPASNIVISQPRVAGAPPQISQLDAWPVTQFNQWCGDFAKRKDLPVLGETSRVPQVPLAGAAAEDLRSKLEDAGSEEAAAEVMAAAGLGDLPTTVTHAKPRRTQRR